MPEQIIKTEKMQRAELRYQAEYGLAELVDIRDILHRFEDQGADMYLQCHILGITHETWRDWRRRFSNGQHVA